MSTSVNASVASPGPYTVPLKLLTDTVAAGSVALAATTANPKRNDLIFILCIFLQIVIRQYDTTWPRRSSSTNLPTASLSAVALAKEDASPQAFLFSQVP